MVSSSAYFCAIHVSYCPETGVEVLDQHIEQVKIDLSGQNKHIRGNDVAGHFFSSSNGYI